MTSLRSRSPGPLPGGRSSAPRTSLWTINETFCIVSAGHDRGCGVDRRRAAVDDGRSLWHDTLEAGDDGEPRPSLAGDLEADVVIVGAGFTGLWTAYHLLRADPHLRVVVLERDVAGAGA